jgi:hypothetical protein
MRYRARTPGPITQAVVHFGLGAAIVAALHAAAPDATARAIRIGYNYVHEIGHMLASVMGGHELHALRIDRNGGHVMVTTQDKNQVVLVAMGPLLPAILATLLIVCAALQRGLALLLPLIGVVATAAVLMGGPYDRAVEATLYGLGIIGLLALLPVRPWLRSPPGFAIGIALTLGVIASARQFGREPVDLERKSDAYRLAELFAPPNIPPETFLGDVRALMLIAMMFIAASGIAIIVNTLKGRQYQ